MQTNQKRQAFILGWKKRISGFPLWLRIGAPILIVLIFGAGGYAYYVDVYKPVQVKESQPALQTATARTGNIILSASGSGSLISGNTASLGFQTGGKITSLNVAVGDHVTKGEVLAEMDNTSAQAAYDQANRALMELTSPAALAAAQGTLATDQQAKAADEYTLKTLISPDTFNWEQQVAAAQLALDQAQAVEQKSPSTEAANNVTNAQTKLDWANAGLLWAHQNYYDVYLPENFTVTKTDTTTHPPTKTTYVDAPSAAEIADARATYAGDLARIQEDQDYLIVLGGGDIPANATGNSLETLLNARTALANAQSALDACSLTATMDGTVTSISANAGDSVGASAFITIVDLSQPYKLNVYLDETDWANIAAGYVVNVTFDILPDNTYTGKVTRVSPTLVQSGGASVVQAVAQLDQTIPGISLPVGASASVEVIGGSAMNVVTVPVGALHKLANGQYTVFVVVDGKPQIRTVEVGLMDLVNAEIKSGLKAGDVVTTGIAATK